MEIWEILLSGAVGALIATLLSVWYQHRSEQIKNRTDVVMAVVDWVDSICAHLTALQVDRKRRYAGQSPSLTEEEGRSMNNDMRILLLSDRITTKVVCVFGEGDTLRKINALKGELTKAAEILWAGTQNNWAKAEAEIMKIFKDKIDPIRASVMKDFFNSTGKISILRREQMTSRIKKIIAREGLLLIGVVVGAFVIAQNQFVQDWVASSGIAAPQLPAQVLRERYGISELGEMILKKAAVISFLSIIALYSVIRFIFWSIKILKNKDIPS